MRKVIKKSGNSLFIRISKDDVVLYGLKKGDVLDIEWVKVKKVKP